MFVYAILSLGMFIKKVIKTDKKTKRQYVYYRLCESYRIKDSIRHRNLINLGDLKELPDPESRKALADSIEALIKGETSLFKGLIDDKVSKLAQSFYSILINRGIVSRREPIVVQRSKEEDWQEVNIDSVRDDESREIGAEWLCKQAIGQLGIAAELRRLGWAQKWIDTALIQIISRMVYPTSEHKTEQWLKMNSGVCELFELPWNKVSRHQLSRASRMLYKDKELLEDYLSVKTNELFDIEDKLFICDLTNTYFEGKKTSSEIARYGRGKEKRNDAKLAALAVVINQAGFIKHSKLYRGNIRDSKTLTEMANGISSSTSLTGRKPVIVMDAGFVSEDNLKTLKEEGYDYVCVSSADMKKYKEMESQEGEIKIKDSRDNPIYLKLIKEEDSRDSYLYVRSDNKKAKEEGMITQQMRRFEEGLMAIQEGISKKGGTKKVEKVYERIGRLKEKFPRVHRCFAIKIKEEEGIAVGIEWRRIKERLDTGIYFIRTSLTIDKEIALWDIYNTIREVEATFRCLKADLKIRPIHHQYDINSISHLNVGVMCYQIVQSIRYKLRQKGIHHDWQNIVRIMNTQKATTTSFEIKSGSRIHIRKCSEPKKEVQEIYDALGFKDRPYRRKKFVLPETANQPP